MMGKNFKIFLITFLLSVPFWWGINIFQNNLEDFFYAMKLQKNPPQLFVAQIVQNRQPNPVQNQPQDPESKSCQEIKSQELQVSAKSAISVDLNIIKDPLEGADKAAHKRIIFDKNPSLKMPIASLTKLMTAVIAVEFYNESYRTEISQEAIAQPEGTGNLTIGEFLKVEDLLHIMLIESSNDAAFALSDVVGEEGFTHLMNLKAKEIGLNDTFFANPTGIDPEDGTTEPNYSTSYDLVKLVEYILAENPEILEIISKKEYALYLENGILHHTLENTNELLGEIPELIGGKTGYTKKAGGCLLVVLKNKEQEKKDGAYLISIVLNSPDRFGEMKKLIEHSLCSN